MRLDRWTAMAALLAGLFLGQATVAEAQCAPSETCVTVGADGKGILGGGILGAEIGFMIPALIIYAGARELDEWWSWILFPVLGAVGGAIAGYYGLEDPTTMTPAGTVQRGFPEAAVAVLAISMALIVPTFVGVLALTSYSPGEQVDSQGATGDEDEESDPAGESEGSGSGEGETETETENSAEPASSAEQATNSAIRRTMAGGPGLVRVDRGQLLLGVPMVYSTDSFTPEERAHMQLGAMADVRIPVVSGVF